MGFQLRKLLSVIILLLSIIIPFSLLALLRIRHAMKYGIYGWINKDVDYFDKKIFILIVVSFFLGIVVAFTRSLLS